MDGSPLGRRGGTVGAPRRENAAVQLLVALCRVSGRVAQIGEKGARRHGGAIVPLSGEPPQFRDEVG